MLTLGELEKGIARLPGSARRRKIEKWARQDLAERFSGRLLAVDQRVADRWGRLSGESESRGEPLPVIDALLAATGLEYGLEVVTRNIADLDYFFSFSPRNASTFPHASSLASLR